MHAFSTVMRLFLSFVAIATLNLLLSTAQGTKQKRVVGGRAAAYQYVRHLAYIQVITNNGFYYTCTGSVLARRWVLTAAHCVDAYGTGDDADKKRTHVYIGTKLTIPKDTERRYFLEDIFLQKKFRSDLNDFRNDVAVLKLKDDIAPHKYYPVQLGTAPRNGSTVIAAGYGSVDEDGTRAVEAMETNVVTQNFNTCSRREITSIRSTLDNRVQVCATSVGFPTEGKTDTCCMFVLLVPFTTTGMRGTMTDVVRFCLSPK